MPAAIERLAELATAAGRSDQLEITVPGEVASDDDVERLAAAGVTRVLVRPWRRSAEAQEALAAFARRFLPDGDGSSAGGDDVNGRPGTTAPAG